MKGKEVILGLLSKQNLTGYSITSMIQTRFSYFFDASTGMVYPALKSLEKDGYVTVEEQVQHGKPNKKIYQITEDGKKYFSEKIHENVEDDIFKSDFLMHMYFGNMLEKDEIDKLIEDERQRIQLKLDQLESDRIEWKKYMTTGQDFSVDFGIKMYKAQLEALKESKTK
ncbi:PadR family transcriptional regulator [Companilactobacillus mishanensis]|uniref:PadR family transcriptional regulator n=1 Tax=Companilactobacillus mishanensis TaxID=2486008 RepID=A0A5P0ZJL5_9LACO|nr:PadR family transcriptional regulator [Companilactobacillus mishanensis]MQS53264.1 PadR family transcriptional regulator [Companilactobacillus mishanensis]